MTDLTEQLLRDEIAQLRDENAKLRAALEKIIANEAYDPDDNRYIAADAIRALDPWAEENQRIYDEKESKISGDDKRSL